MVDIFPTILHLGYVTTTTKYFYCRKQAYIINIYPNNTDKDDIAGEYTIQLNYWIVYMNMTNRLEYYILMYTYTKQIK